MASDPATTTLVIQLMPLMMREFNVKLDPELVFSDRKYAETMLNLAETAVNEKLRRFSSQLRARLQELASMPPGAVRSAQPFSLTGGVQPPDDDSAKLPEQSSHGPRGDVDRKYVRTLR